MSLLKAWNRESYPLGHNTEFKVDPFAKYGGESIVNKLAQEEKKKKHSSIIFLVPDLKNFI